MDPWCLNRFYGTRLGVLQRGNWEFVLDWSMGLNLAITPILSLPSLYCLAYDAKLQYLNELIHYNNTTLILKIKKI